MLTLDPASVCDVCAEDYGPHNLPRSIPCGHVLCEDCSTTICQKTSPRLAPACPFCREPFTPDSVRIVRADCSASSSASASGATTPRRAFAAIEANDDTIVWDHHRREDERPLPFDTDNARYRSEARRLEDKVARVAAKKCSVEEVHTLHKELQEWLTSEVQTAADGQHASLQLSAALLRAILMNHLAHSEASKVAKGVEASLRGRLEDFELIRQKFEADARKQKALLAQKTQECHQLKAELSRLKINATASSLGLASTHSHTQIMRQSISSIPALPETPTPSPTPAPGSTAGSPSPLSRYSHTRALSLHASSRPAGAGLLRSMTPGPGHSRAMTPLPPPLPRATTPALPILSRPPVPPKPRTLSSPSPPKYFRGPVDDREHAAGAGHKERTRRHERWIPSPEAGTDSGGGARGARAMTSAKSS